MTKGGGKRLTGGRNKQEFAVQAAEK